MNPPNHCAAHAGTVMSDSTNPTAPSGTDTVSPVIASPLNSGRTPLETVSRFPLRDAKSSLGDDAVRTWRVHKWNEIVRRSRWDEPDRTGASLGSAVPELLH